MNERENGTAAQYLSAFHCPEYKQKWCGLEGTILDLLENGVNASSGQLSPGISPGSCESPAADPTFVFASDYTRSSQFPKLLPGRWAT